MLDGVRSFMHAGSVDFTQIAHHIASCSWKFVVVHLNDPSEFWRNEGLRFPESGYGRNLRKRRPSWLQNLSVCRVFLGREMRCSAHTV